MDLLNLFIRYGWQLALVGVLGCIVVGLLKKPLTKLLKKADSQATEDRFDTVGYLLGFIIAMLLGCLYTLAADKLHWLYNVLEDGTKEYTIVDWRNYIYNGLGAWAYQTIFYGAWKKFGLRRLFLFTGRAIRNAIIASADKNKDGAVDFDEASSVIKGLLKDGKLDIEDVLDTVAEVVPAAAKELSLAIGDVVDEDDEPSVRQLKKVADSVIDKIPNEQLQQVADALKDKASDIAEGVQRVPVIVPDSTKLPVVEEGETVDDGTPKRPTISF